MECKTKKDWELLKEFDAGYDCIEVDVYPYDSEEPVRANIFVMEGYESENAKLPTEKLPQVRASFSFLVRTVGFTILTYTCVSRSLQERYVKVIATGIRQHGVDDEYIDYSILNVPYIPSRKPDEYLAFPKEKEKLKTISFTEYSKKAKKKMWFLIGTKVIQLGEHDPNCPFVEWIASRLVGKSDCTWTMLQTLFDPDLPVCETEEDVEPLHIAWAENQLAEKFEQADLTGSVAAFIKEPSSNGDSKVGRFSSSLKRFSVMKK